MVRNRKETKYGVLVKTVSRQIATSISDTNANFIQRFLTAWYLSAHFVVSVQYKAYIQNLKLWHLLSYHFKEIDLLMY